MGGGGFRQGREGGGLPGGEGGGRRNPDPARSPGKFSSESHSSGDDCYFPLLRAGIRPLLLPDRREPFTFLVVVFGIEVSWNVNLTCKNEPGFTVSSLFYQVARAHALGEVHVDLLRRRKCRFDSCCCRRSKWSRSGTRVCWS